MANQERETPAERGEPPKITLNPGDVAEPGTTGTGENVCRECHGTGRIASGECPNCGGTGKVIKAIGGA